MGFLVENASMSQLSYVWKYVPQCLSPALHRDLFCFPPRYRSLLCLYFRGGNGTSTLLCREWLSILWPLGLGGRGCQRQLSRTELRGRQAAPSSDRSLCRVPNFLALCCLGSRTGKPTEVPAKYSSSSCLDTRVLSHCENQKK